MHSDNEKFTHFFSQALYGLLAGNESSSVLFSDFILNREWHGERRQQGEPRSPAAIIVQRRKREDARDCVPAGQRVHYVVTRPSLGATRLLDRIYSPEEYARRA